MRWMKRIFIVLFCLTLLGGLGTLVAMRLQETLADTGGSARGSGKRDRPPAPVAVAEVEVGEIVLRRTFSGTLESPAGFVASAKVGGRVERIHVDLADTVTRGRVVVELDSAEHEQAVAQAKAELAVAEANLAEANNSHTIAKRELDRRQTLRERGVTSDTQLDASIADELAKRSAIEVAKAQRTRAEAELESARIRLNYTSVKASWTGGDDDRVVADRFVEEGDTVGANAPLIRIVELDPLQAVVFVAERDYARIVPGQPVKLRTDAYPGEMFAGEVSRVSPVFDSGSRQARVELRVANPDHRLKPGMFVRAETILDRAERVTIVPVGALVLRNGQDGVFTIDGPGGDDDTLTVSFRPVTLGIREGDRVQVTGPGVTGRVVTLGHQLISDGAKVVIPKLEGDAEVPRGTRGPRDPGT